MMTALRKKERNKHYIRHHAATTQVHLEKDLK